MLNAARRAVRSTRHALDEFLALPAGVIVSFVLLAAGTWWLDRARYETLEPLREFLRLNLFADAGATRELLSAVASGVITVTSITISVLVVALQQLATSMTTAVFDQFLRRRTNQLYFGFFVGLSLFTLITLSTVSAATPSLNPIIGGTVALLATFAALPLLIVLLYTTVNQMRPSQIIDTIHDHVLEARRRQLELVERTRRAPHRSANRAEPCRVAAPTDGFVTWLDLGALCRAVSEAGDAAEIVLEVSIGCHRAYGEPLAEIAAGEGAQRDALARAVCAAVHLDPQRDVGSDPAYGLEQLETIAWTSVSSSKSDPASGLLVIHSLRDILVRWADEEGERAQGPADGAEPAPIVYRDVVPERLLDAFESLAVCSSESMQHQTYAEIVRTLAGSFERLPKGWQPRIEDIVLRMLTALGDHVLTLPLDGALVELGAVLRAAGREPAAARVFAARERLRRSLGELDSRFTRAAH